MRHEWFRSSAVQSFIGVGIAATVVSLFVFTFRDCWLLMSGNIRRVLSIQEVWYLILATVAVTFCGFTFFIWRPMYPRIVIALLAVSMASQVVQSIFPLPAQFVRLTAFCRICVSIAAVVLYFRASRQRS